MIHREMATEETSEEVAAEVPDSCIIRAVFEEFYRGWDRAGTGKPCRPPALLSEEMQRAYVEGYRARNC